MRKILFVLMAITMVACKKEEINPSVDKGTTITLYVTGDGVAYTQLDYYDIAGEHRYESYASNLLVVDSIDWSKPLDLSSKVIKNAGTPYWETVDGNFTLNKENELISQWSGHYYFYNN